MFVERSKNNGKDYLRLAKSQRVIDAKGVKTAKKTVRKINVQHSSEMHTD